MSTIAVEPAAMTYTRLPEHPFESCDGHETGTVQAVVTVTKGVFEVTLCGNCARKFGYEHTATAPKENRLQGSEH